MKYYNPKNGRIGIINNIKLHGTDCYIADYDDEKTGCGISQIKYTLKYAEAVMTAHGYTRFGVVDESGCRRYTMMLAELQDVYKKFENFVADCTVQEYKANKEHIVAVYTLLHNHINAEATK